MAGLLYFHTRIAVFLRLPVACILFCCTYAHYLIYTLRKWDIKCILQLLSAISDKTYFIFGGLGA